MTRAVEHNCAKSYSWTMAAQETEVERKADFLILLDWPEAIGGIGMSHSA
jgi:hypothetical protein